MPLADTFLGGFLSFLAVGVRLLVRVLGFSQGTRL